MYSYILNKLFHLVFNLSTNPLNCNWGVKEHPFKNFKWLYPNFEAQNNYLIFSKKT